MNAKGWGCWRLGIVLLFALALLGAVAPSTIQAESTDQVNEVRRILEDNHLSKPGSEKLNEAAIDAMVQSLHDPYTEYFNAEEWKTFSNDLEQNFTGIGIVMTDEGGVVYVEDVIPGTPADQAGVEPGDAIMSADGTSVKGVALPELQKRLKGAEGTAVTLGVSRDGKPLTFIIVRKSLQLPVASGQLMGDGVGYLSLTGFTSDAGNVFRKQLEKLEKSGMTSLIVDLRNNGGGFVNAAQQIAALFVKDGVLAHLKDRNGDDHPIQVEGGIKPYPLTLLVNGNSASASELLAGALQDYGLAKLVGTKTFGKGVVQSIIPLESGGVVKVTVQEYFTPNGRKVDKTGLTPDVAIEGSGEQLIAAFRNAGGLDLTMTLGKGTVIVNSVRMARPNAAVFQDKKWFVNLRLASAFAGFAVTYDKKTKTATLSRDGSSHQVSNGNPGLINRQGYSLIDLIVLEKWFPGLQSETVAGQLKLTVR